MLKINKKSNQLFLATAILILISGTSSFAQKDNLGDEQINVVKPYQPTLSDAFKISDTPVRDTSVSFTPDMKYDVNPVQYPTVYTISPIKPVKIKDDNIKKLYHGFIKGGYGTNNTTYAEAFYNSLRSKDFDAGVHFSHLSSTGKIKGYGYPGMGETGISLFGTRFFDNSKLHGELGYNRLSYHWYGYNSPPDILSKSETKHSFDDIHGDFGFKSNDKDVDRFRYDAGISFYNFGDNKSNEENRIDFKANAGKKINDYDFSSLLEFDFLNYNTEAFDAENHHILRINPRISTKMDRLTLTAGANVAIESNDITKFHLYPHARIDAELISDMLSVYGQVTGNLERNSFRSFAMENQFIGAYVPVVNTNNKLEISGGINAKIDKQLSVHASASLKRLNDDAFYVNIPTFNSLVIYDVFYDNNTQSNVHAEVVYEQPEKMGISLAADYFGNKTSQQDKPLFRPDFKFGLNGYYSIGEKIYLGTQLGYVTTRNAVNYDTGDYTTLKGYVDANLSVDYRYTKVLSVFVNLNNFTASKYSRWYNYPSYQFSAMAGLTWSF